MTSTFFMDPLGKGLWNEWERDHVFSLLGLVWYNTSRSDSCCPVLDSNFALLLENLRRARVAEAPKARLDFFCGADLFWGADFFSGAGEEVVSMVTPETMTKRRFLTHPFSTVAYAMRVLFFVLCALNPRKCIVSFDSQYLEQTHRRDKGHSKKCENHSFFALLRPTLEENENLSLLYTGHCLYESACEV